MRPHGVVSPIGSAAPRVPPGSAASVAWVEENTYCIALMGELDLAYADALKAALDKALASDASSIVVDLSGLDFIDSSGLAAIAQACRGRGERIKLLRGPRRVHRVFEVTGLDQKLPFVE